MENNFIVQKHTYNTWTFKKRLIVFVIVAIVLFISFFIFKVEKTFSLVNGKIVYIESDEDEEIPLEENRIDILIMGLRGDGDAAYGENLTDTMMLLSIQTETSQAALISIPRDLYIKIPKFNKMEKINAAYAYSMSAYGDGAILSKRVVQRVTGVYIDHTIAIDFSAFEKLIDTIGGISVYVPQDFSEKLQWGYEFFVPKGMHHMDGETALYYARSRYSSNDFDRSRRQQDILKALADTLTKSRVFSNPITLNNILDTISDGTKTDIDFFNMLSLLKYARAIKPKDIIRVVLDDSPDSPLTSGQVGNAYVLYPKEGIENYTNIRNMIKNIFNDKSVLK